MFKKEKSNVVLNDENKKTNKFSEKIKSFFKSRKTKRGGLAVLLTAIFIAVIIGLNFVASLLVNRFPALSFDLTSNSSFELQSDTVEYLQNLSKDVNIYVLTTKKNLEAQGEYYVQAEKLIEQFPSYSDHITLKYIDLTKQPTFTSKYTDIDWMSGSYILLIESGDSHRVLAASDLFDYDQESYYSTGSYEVNGQHVEQAVITSILNVTTDDKIKVSILNGQDELSCDALKTLLANNAYETEDVSLLNGEISEDSQFLIIFAPTIDIDDKALETISNWLYNDGKYGHNLIYVPNDQREEKMPNMDSLLEEWGMKITSGLVFETDTSHMTNTSNPYLISIMDYNDQEYTDGLKTIDVPVVMLYTVPIEITDENKAKALLTSSDQAVVMPMDADEDWDYNSATPQTLNGVVLSTQSGDENSSNVLVIGSYDALGDSALSSTSFNNTSYFMNLINKLANKEDAGITIEGKSLTSGQLGVTDSTTATLISLIVRFIIPIGILLVGLIIWLRRRNK